MDRITVRQAVNYMRLLESRMRANMEIAVTDVHREGSPPSGYDNTAEFKRDAKERINDNFDLISIVSELKRAIYYSNYTTNVIFKDDGYNVADLLRKRKEYELVNEYVESVIYAMADAHDASDSRNEGEVQAGDTIATNALIEKVSCETELSSEETAELYKKLLLAHVQAHRWTVSMPDGLVGWCKDQKRGAETMIAEITAAVEESDAVTKVYVRSLSKFLEKVLPTKKDTGETEKETQGHASSDSLPADELREFFSDDTPPPAG